MDAAQDAANTQDANTAEDAAEIVTTEDSGILTIRLNRPEAHNAVTRAMSFAIAAAVDRLDADDSLFVAILTGTGRSFCSGMDLKGFLRGEHPEVEGRGFGGFTNRPPKKPIIAAVEGYALAGGFELVLACDLVVAAENAQFGLPEVTRGLIAGSGGLLRLPAAIPPRIAMEYVLTGKPMSAADAERWGLVNRVTPAGESLAVARDLASAISRNAPLAIRQSKRILNEASDWPAAERWDRQEAALQAIFGSRDAAEGARAFGDKRAPAWEGH